jgi:catechol-2,3-dioxygenase
VTFANDRIAFLTFDEEHHRVALVATAAYAPPVDVPQVGFYHAAFTYASLGELITTYERLLSCGIAPYRTIHHGPTVSLYYRDPDRNAIELQVDAFPDARSATQWMSGETFRRNPIGIELDMNAYVAAFRSGVPLATLLKRPDDL